MTVIAIGLNHRSAPIEVLEGIAIAADALPKALTEITSSAFVNEAVVLSTCNRTEVYIHAERFHDAYHDVRDALSVVSGLDVDTFVDRLYVHYQDDAIAHLFAVTAGLDSAVLGEHEILGQVKNAFEAARSEGTAGTLLGQLFEHAIACGKRVRTATDIGRSTASLSHAAVSLVREQIGTLEGRRVLLVGAGEVGASVATALSKQADLHLSVTNRTAARAEEVARAIDGAVIDFDDLHDALSHADVVISATAAPGHVISRSELEAACAERTDRPLVLDLAVPRDVEPSVTEIAGLELLVLADLQAFANRGLERRQEAAVEARLVVTAEIERFREASSAREMAPLIGSLHQQSDQLRRAEIERHRNRLADLSAEEREAVEAMTKALVAKLLHEPTVRLKKAAGSHRGERLAEAARELFDLQ